MAVALRASFDAGTPPSRAGDAVRLDLGCCFALQGALSRRSRRRCQRSRHEWHDLPVDPPACWPPCLFNACTPLPRKPSPKQTGGSRRPHLRKRPQRNRRSRPRAQRARRNGRQFVHRLADLAFDGRKTLPISDTAALRSASRDAITRECRRPTNVRPPSKWAPLPSETLDEARAIAAALGASPQSVIWGIQASNSGQGKHVGRQSGGVRHARRHRRLRAGPA